MNQFRKRKEKEIELLDRDLAREISRDEGKDRAVPLCLTLQQCRDVDPKVRDADEGELSCRTL
jgi:hypothetical protein